MSGDVCRLLIYLSLLGSGRLAKVLLRCLNFSCASGEAHLCCLTDSRCGSVECVRVVQWRSLRGTVIGGGRWEVGCGCASHAAQCCGRPCINGLSGDVCVRPDSGLTDNSLLLVEIVLLLPSSLV